MSRPSRFNTPMVPAINAFLFEALSGEFVGPDANTHRLSRLAVAALHKGEDRTSNIGSSRDRIHHEITHSPSWAPDHTITLTGHGDSQLVEVRIGFVSLGRTDEEDVVSNNLSVWDLSAVSTPRPQLRIQYPRQPEYKDQELYRHDVDDPESLDLAQTIITRAAQQMFENLG